MRAYSPVLADVGIDQSTFLDFLETLGRACRASPWIHTINLASIGTLFLPTATSIAVSIAIQLATMTAIEAHSRYK